MQRFFKIPFLASIASLSFSLVACKQDVNDAQASASTVKSDWEEAAVEDQARSYVIDWACEPKRYGAAAELTIKDQEEYCEWKTVSTNARAKTCRYTTSFDHKRDFYLNSRGQTSVNTISAARTLVDVCNKDALTRLESGKTAGTLCTGVPEGCVNGRNSDPEICTKVRWATGEKFADNIDYCVDKLTARDSILLKAPLMQFGLLTDLPENCTYATADHTEVTCTIPPEDDCFSMTGQLRPGMRVQTKAKTDELSTLPSSRECYVP